MIKDETVRMPTVAVCIPYHSGALWNIVRWLNSANEQAPCAECASLKDHGWDVWNEHHQNGPWTDNALAALIVGRLVSAGDLQEILRLNRSNFNWNEAIFDAIWKYFGCLVGDDIMSVVRSKYDFQENRCIGFDYTLTSGIDRNMTDKMFQHLLDYVDLHFKISVTTDHGSFVESVKSKRRSFSIKADYMCMAVLPESMQETFQLLAFPNPDQPPWIRSSRKPACSLYYDSVLYTFSPYHQNIYTPPWRPFRTDVLHEDVSLEYSIQNRVFETRLNTACHKIKTRGKMCVALRQVQDIAEHIGCVPFFYRYLSEISDLPYCNQTLYIQNENVLTKNVDSYKKACKNRCDYDFYKWKHFSRYYVPEDHNWYCRMNFTSLTDPFVEFKIVAADTPEKFAAQAGGIINLYLGFSGMSVCALIGYCIDRLMKWKNEKKPKNKIGSTTAEVQTLQVERVRQTSKTSSIESDENGIKQEVMNLRAEVDQLKKMVQSLMHVAKKQVP